jgi:pimeloyl-ACP methyl ester carboxylesterase
MMGSILSASRRRVEVAVPTNPFPVGNTTSSTTLNNDLMTVYNYRANCTNPGGFIVLSGSARNASGALGNAIDHSNATCLVSCAPLFDEARWDFAGYQLAGVVDSDLNPRPFAEWTTHNIHALIDWMRAREGRPTMPMSMFGHSAGGRHNSRLSAYHCPPGIRRIIVSNPSDHVRASLTEDTPYGFNDLPAGFNRTEMMKAYLAVPMTIYLGTEDTDSADPELTHSAAAERQGANRFERGNFVFNEGEDVAAANGWPFNWRLVHAPGVGHSSEGMFESPAFAQAWAD